MEWVDVRSLAHVARSTPPLRLQLTMFPYQLPAASRGQEYFSVRSIRLSSLLPAGYTMTDIGVCRRCSFNNCVCVFFSTANKAKVCKKCGAMVFCVLPW